ncbi:MAG: recombinase family protein [Lachnospiraceae bacterium]|nr:recombinase family protein [Lachnospiraceae bacterium]
MLAEDRIWLRKEQPDKKKIWQAALYVRLSREDGDKEESDSIVNQKELLQQFASFESDVVVRDVYVDDGWSGTNFDRPEFIRMMEDIKSGAVNCVIVKDLSRFGRNYIDVGQYIEKIFPLMDIRFISVTDNLDSVKNPQTMNNIIVPFKNLINDEYCRDISNKVRSSLDLKRKQGKHIGSFACYGYKKDPEDHNHLVIDPEAAEVVRDIFRWYKSGMSILGISKKLNQLGVPNPSCYKKLQGLRYKNRYEKMTDHRWPESSVRRILANRMYIGDLVQGLIKIKSYKVQVAQRQAKDDWIIVPGTHEAIISKEDFEVVQELLRRNTRVAPAKTDAKVYLFSGFIRCCACGSSMVRKPYVHSYGEYNYFACTTYAKRDKNACTKHSIRADLIEKFVLQSVQTQIALAVELEKAIEEINNHKVINKEAVTLRKTLDKTREEQEQVRKMMLDLYPDWKAGTITQSEYTQLKARFENQKAELSRKIEDLTDKIALVEKGQDRTNQFLENFIRYKNIDHLTREVVVALIDMIYVYEENKIKIVFKYRDPYEAAREYIENNKELLNSSMAEIILK